MPLPDDSSDKALRRLDRRLDALQAQRTVRAGSAGSVGVGYRLFGEVVGGVLGGLGLGLALDHFAHTQPWGVIGGLLLGTALSVSAAAATAARTADQMKAGTGAPPSATGESDDEED
jgi:ATP synthase protein I